MTAVADQLKAVPIFGDLSQRQLRKLASQARERSFRPGVAVVQQGEMSGVGFFVIVDGTATVTVDGKNVATLGAGAHFGELALLTESVRTATIVAETRLACLVIASWDFRRFAKENTDVMWKLVQHLAQLVAREQGRPDRPSAR